MEAEHFEWHGSLPGHPRVVLSFALDSLTLSTLHVNIAHFPYPPPNSRSRVDSSEPPGWTLFTASGSYYFAAASMNQGHVHPEKALVIDPDDYLLTLSVGRTSLQAVPLPSLLPQRLNASLSLSGSLPQHANFTKKALFSLPPNNASSMRP